MDTTEIDIEQALGELIGDRIELRKRQELMEQWLRLAQSLAGKQHRKALESGRASNLDDWSEIAQWALLKAGLKFDFDRKISFGTYLGKVCQREFERATVLPEVSLSDDDGGEIQLDSHEPDTIVEAELTPDFSGNMQNALASLSHRERYVIKATVFQDASLGEVASVIGVSSTMARLVQRRALSRLATAIQHPELCGRQGELFTQPPQVQDVDDLDRVPADRAG